MIIGYEDFKNYQKLIKRKLLERDQIFRMGGPKFQQRCYV